MCSEMLLTSRVPSWESLFPPQVGVRQSLLQHWQARGAGDNRQTDDRGAPASLLQAAVDWSCSRSYNEQGNGKERLSGGATLGDGYGCTRVDGPKAPAQKPSGRPRVGRVQRSWWGKGPQIKDAAGRSVRAAFRRILKQTSRCQD